MLIQLGEGGMLTRTIFLGPAVGILSPQGLEMHHQDPPICNLTNTQEHTGIHRNAQERMGKHGNARENTGSTGNQPESVAGRSSQGFGALLLTRASPSLAKH